MKLKFSSQSVPKSGTLVITVASGGKLSGAGSDADLASGGHLTRAMKAAKFDGKRINCSMWWHRLP
jgi:leucyl aminopeptidase